MLKIDYVARNQSQNLSVDLLGLLPISPVLLPAYYWRENTDMELSERSHESKCPAVATYPTPEGSLLCKSMVSEPWV